MNLKVIVLGTEGKTYEHNFSGFEGQELELHNLEDFDEDLGVEINGGEPLNLYEYLKEKTSDEDFQEEVADDMEEDYGKIMFNEDLKNICFQFIAHMLSAEEETEELNEEIKNYLLEKGLTFEKTVTINVDDTRNDETRYLWQNFGIQGSDVFY